jgi:hypothetical protein
LGEGEGKEQKGAAQKYFEAWLSEMDYAAVDRLKVSLAMPSYQITQY